MFGEECHSGKSSISLSSPLSFHVTESLYVNWRVFVFEGEEKAKCSLCLCNCCNMQ